MLWTPGGLWPPHSVAHRAGAEAPTDPVVCLTFLEDAKRQIILKELEFNVTYSCFLTKKTLNCLLKRMSLSNSLLF